jgi:glycosyltransferase involved in cell wall biosynthesis
MNSTTSNKRVVLIATPVLLVGGTEIQTLSVVQTLIQTDYHVIVCCYYEFDITVVEWFKSVGAEVIVMKFKRNDGLFHLAKGLIRLFRELKPDIVHVQYLAPGLVPIVAARMAGIKTIFSTVHIAGSVAYGRKAKFLLRLASKFCKTFFCVSKGVEEFWFGSSQVLDPARIDNSRKHYTIYNAVDIEKIEKVIDKTDINSLRSSLGIHKKRVLGIVGRLAHQKGHAVLLDAMPEVIRHFPDVVLLVIGKGPEREFLEKKAGEVGIGRHILWLGERRQEDIFRLYSIMDIFVMPSLYEGFGLTAAEAMAAGLPVVGTNIEGLSEIIENNVNGYLVTVNNSNELAKAVIKLLIDSKNAKTIGMNGYEKIKKFFSMENFRKSWLAAYRNLKNAD